MSRLEIDHYGQGRITAGSARHGAGGEIMREAHIVTVHTQLANPCRNCHQPILRGEKYYLLGRRGVVHIEHFSNDDLPPVFPEKIFGEENLLNTQAHPKAPWVREQYLYLAILEDAIQCAFRYQFPKNRHEKRLEREAMEWIQEINEMWACSFNNCCRAIGAEPEYVRRGILNRREEVRHAAFQQPTGMVAKVHIPTTKRINHITRPSIHFTGRE